MKNLPAAAIAVLVAALLGACHFWPEELESLAEAIERQVSGETTAWRVGGDIVVIDIAGSPRYHDAPARREAVATDIAAQATAASPGPLESVMVTFHEGEVTDDDEKMHEFIFLVTDGRPELQPVFNFDATGPLTLDDFRPTLEKVGERLTEEQRACVRREVEERARAAGDPETLDPSTVEFLDAETWGPLDAPGKRIILVQAIGTAASFACIAARSPEPATG